ncbi:M15 family metallopeptidase [Psychroflexus sediminis]|uniref:D-alanyl-D-alanine carboxypeptidase n=1 Tax=Psychroflexus sediminis TaxID=470826 RepID=A0A1G7VUB5_9FLAO|nr:M15 family metallopeptidase [Psychroflexus sediminis]SDG62490.1 D-alanyl-D-alanine carboxypeptidase [Psychroflexus sediminis]
MKRKRFLKTSILAGIGSQLQLNSELFKLFEFEDIKIENLLGLSQSHLKSEFILLEEDTFKAFSLMKSSALEDGITLKIVSGYRSFEQQKEIWEWKFKQLTKTKAPIQAISEIMTYSSIPGTSRHHWGTDIDLIDDSVIVPEGDLLLEKHYHGNAPFSKMKSWMEKNSSDFGFRLVYTRDDTRTGFNYEPWHYSYAPKAKLYLDLQSSEKYRKAWRNLEFKGKSYMTDSFMDSYFKNYGFGIHPSLMPS